MSTSDNLYDRIAALDLRRPYVWELRISAAEFSVLEAAVQAGTTTAIQNVVYLAEWYKRCYDGGTAKPVREFDCQRLFEEAGIDPAHNLFQTENGNKTWQYSIFVLGGVSIPFELGKTSKKFLKELCRIYYGEDGDVDQLGGKDRAVAFKESVRTCGSVYDYLKAILSKDLPFAQEDLADRNSPEVEFIERIKSANDEILKSKFDVEWVIGFDPDATYMTRKLRLVLKPESLGGVNHQYLKFERVQSWGFARPETCKRIVVGVRFLLDTSVVADADFAKPIIEYSTTGNRETGFVAWYTERRSKRIDVPAGRFNAVEIVARDDRGRERSVETFKVDTWMQVFRAPDGYNEWTTLHASQRESAVICPGNFEMLDVGPTEAIYRKKFWVKGGCVSDTYQWRSVYDTVKFKDESGAVVALFNRQGYDQIVTRLHTDVLRYQDGCVNYVVDRDDEYDESLLPLIFSRDDLVVRHFESRNDMRDGSFSEGACERIEFLSRGIYREWTETEVPKPGKTTLRLTVKDVARKLTAYYLPIEIVRDCDSGRIRCGDEVIEGRCIRDGVPTDPVVHKSIGADNEFVSLEIWRATKHKEFVRNGRVVKYVEDGEPAEISYALKDGLEIHDFSLSGYSEYRCQDIEGIYRLDAFRPADNSHLAALSNQAKVQVATTLDPQAPGWLWVNLAKKSSDEGSGKMLYWNFASDVELEEVDAEFGCSGNDVVFQSLKTFEGLCVQSPRLGNYNAFRFRPMKARVDLVKCFEVATEHRVYYFAMLPLRMPQINLSTELYIPLRDRRGGELTDEDKAGLIRLAEEMGFDWQEKYGISIY